jgi:hypothetical protein
MKNCRRADIFKVQNKAREHRTTYNPVVFLRALFCMSCDSTQYLVVQPIATRHRRLTPRSQKLSSQLILPFFFPVRTRLEARRQRPLRFRKIMHGRNEWKNRRRQSSFHIPVPILLSLAYRRKMRCSKHKSMLWRKKGLASAVSS